MAHFTRISIPLVGSTGGSVAYSTPLNGKLCSIRYSSGGTISATAPVTVANEKTDESYFVKAIGSGSVTWRPAKAICDSTGGALATYTYPEFAFERAKCSVGATTVSGQTGTLLLAFA